MANFIPRKFSQLWDAPAASAGQYLGWDSAGKLAAVSITTGAPSQLVNGAEVASLGSDGTLQLPGHVYAGPGGAYRVYTQAVLGPSFGNSLIVAGTPYDSSSAVSLILDSTNQLTSSGSRIASFRNGGLERAALTSDGSLTLSGGLSMPAGQYLDLGAGARMVSDSGFGALKFNSAVYFPFIYSGPDGVSSNGGSLYLHGQLSDSSSATGIILDTASLSVPGSRILSIRNAGAEKVYVDSYGWIGAQGILSMGGSSFWGSGINLYSVLAFGAFIPASPADGTVWYDGTSLRVRLGGVTKTITVS